MNANPEDVKVGQVWADNDWREAGRQMRVDRIEGDHAFCTVTAQKDGKLNRRKRTRIRLDRFKPTQRGYVLVDGGLGA